MPTQLHTRLLLSYSVRAEQQQLRPNGPQSLKYSLFRSLQKNWNLCCSSCHNWQLLVPECSEQMEKRMGFYVAITRMAANYFL